jgi:hypothetical protein
VNAKSGPHPEAGAAPLRVAIISTPRSGNTWLRRVLARSFALDEVAIHHPWAIAVDTVPPRAVIQMHWPRDETAMKLVEDLGGQVVTIVRHPLDVFLSIVRFSRYEPLTALWLLGAHGNEEGVVAHGPNDQAAIDYASGQRFRALLAVTAEWWDHAVPLTYERAAGDPHATVLDLAGALGVVPASDPADAVRDNTFERLHSLDPGHHPVGPSKTWREFLTADTIAAIRGPLSWHVDRFGYDTSVDSAPDIVEATRKWEASTTLAPVAPNARLARVVDVIRANYETSTSAGT